MSSGIAKDIERCFSEPTIFAFPSPSFADINDPTGPDEGPSRVTQQSSICPSR
jgi:hypothetical protein